MLFPENPTNGQKALALGKWYRYNSVKLSWELDRVLDTGEVSSAGLINLINAEVVPNSAAINTTTNAVVNLFTSQNGTASPQRPEQGDPFNSIASVINWLKDNSRKFGSGTKVIVNLGAFEHLVTSDLSLEVSVSSITFRGSLPAFSSVYELLEIDIRGLTSSNSSAVQSSIRSKSGAAGRPRIRFASGGFFTGVPPTVTSVAETSRGFLEEVAFENLVISGPTLELGSRSCVFMGGTASVTVDNCAAEDLIPNLVELSRFCRGARIKKSIFTNARCISSIGSRVELEDCCFLSGPVVASQNGSLEIKRCLIGNRADPVVCAQSDVSILDSLMKRSTFSMVRSTCSTLECVNLEIEDTSSSPLTLSQGSTVLKNCTFNNPAFGISISEGSLLAEALTVSGGTGNPSVISAVAAHVVITKESNFSNNSQPIYTATRGSSISLDSSTIGNGVQSGSPSAETVSTSAIVSQVI